LYSRRNKLSKIIWCMSIFYIIKVCSNEGTSVFVTAMLFSLYLTCSCMYPSNLMVTATYICILIIENVPSTNLALRMLQTSWVRFQWPGWCARGKWIGICKLLLPWYCIPQAPVVSWCLGWCLHYYQYCSVYYMDLKTSSTSVYPNMHVHFKLVKEYTNK
jgi:hypothetical protein